MKILDYIPKDYPTNEREWGDLGISSEVRWIDRGFDVSQIVDERSPSRFVYTTIEVQKNSQLKFGMSGWNCGFIDAFLPNLWPTCLSFQGMISLIRAKREDLNNRASALIAGDSEIAKISIHVAASLGFKSVGLITENYDPKAWLGVPILGVKFFQIDPSHLTQEPPQTSLLINATEGAERELMVDDLSYLNFMLPGGIVFDASYFSESARLQEEASRTQFPVISSSQLLSETARIYANLAKRLE